MTKPMPSIFEQLMSCAAHAASREPNRRWVGSIRGPGVVQGSATDEVLKVLAGIYPGTATHSELMSKTGFARGAVCWALHYLAERELIKVFGDSRNVRYQRYQSIPGAEVTYTNC